MTSWSEVRPAAERRARRGAGVARTLAPFVAAGALALLGLTTMAFVVAGVGVALAALARVRPAWAHQVDRALAAFGALVGRVLSTVLLGTVEVLVFLPLAALAQLLRRDLLTAPGHRGRRGWLTRATSDEVPVRRPFGAEVAAGAAPHPVARVAFVAVRALGWVVIVLALNYGLGWLWDEYVDSHEDTAAASTPRSLVETLASSPAMAPYSWSEGYWDEFRALDHEFRPFILSRVTEADGPYIIAEGAVRRSYEPERLSADAPEVWILGGAAAWGQGQRDLHTIPSELARRAEAEGSPIRVRNLGQPGYTSWQAALLLEQELAVRPAPDLVLFYDGAADVAVQLERPSEDPTHYNVDGVTASLTGRDSAREQAQDWWGEYREVSVVNRALERLEGLLGVQPAGADEPGLADRVADLHARSVDLASFVAEEHDVEAVFAWQAAEGVTGDGGAYRRVAQAEDQGPYGAIDLSAVLDDEDDVYLDGVLTNERGAAVVAERLWRVVHERLGGPSGG